MTQLATQGDTWPVAGFETRQDQTQEGHEGDLREKEEIVDRASFPT